jgi:hypothetical protein
VEGSHEGRQEMTGMVFGHLGSGGWFLVCMLRARMPAPNGPAPWRQREIIAAIVGTRHDGYA